MRFIIVFARKSVFERGISGSSGSVPGGVRVTFEADAPRYLADQALNGARNSSVSAEWI